MKDREDYPLKKFATPHSFERWLSRNHGKVQGIRIQMARKSSGIRSINYAQALDIALCYGWIDGQAKSMDEQWFCQRFTPRRSRSLWSKRNRDIVARLIEEGRMQPAGQADHRPDQRPLELPGRGRRSRRQQPAAVRDERPAVCTKVAVAPRPRLCGGEGMGVRGIPNPRDVL